MLAFGWREDLRRAADEHSMRSIQISDLGQELLHQSPELLKPWIRWTSTSLDEVPVVPLPFADRSAVQGVESDQWYACLEWQVIIAEPPGG